MIILPRGNRTGPRGFGPRTGRGLGYCSGYSTPGYTKGPGMGWGRGYGGGWGWRGGGGWGYGRGSYPDTFFHPSDTPPSYSQPTVTPWQGSLSPEDESKFLEQSLTNLKKEIKLSETRLEELALEKKNQ